MTLAYKHTYIQSFETMIVIIIKHMMIMMMIVDHDRQTNNTKTKMNGKKSYGLYVCVLRCIIRLSEKND